jgi:hypothetical protein
MAWIYIVLTLITLGVVAKAVWFVRHVKQIDEEIQKRSWE